MYATETRGIDDIDIFDRGAAPWAPVAEVVVAVVTDASRAKQAASFLRFLETPDARTILREHGFGIPGD